MTIIRWIHDNLWREGTILAQSSQQAQFPARNTQGDLKKLAWRSSGRFIITAANKYIDINEGGGELTATLTEGTYTAATLAAEIKAQLETAGALTYTVTYSTTAGTWTIAASGNFSLLWQSGSHAASSAGATIGFAVAADDTGTDTYTSDGAAIHTSEAVDCDLGAAYEYDFVGILGHNLTSSAVIKIYGADDAAFTTSVVTDTLTHNGNNIYEFLTTARTKRYTRFYVEDPANPSIYVKVGVIVLGKYATFNRNFGAYSEGEVDSSEVEYSPSMNLLVVQSRPKLINWELPFRGLNAASAAIARQILANNGITKSMVVNFDSTAANSNSHWVHLKETSPIEMQHHNCYSWTAALEESV